MSATVVARYPRSVIEAARPSSSRRRNGSISTDSAEAGSSATVVATSDSFRRIPLASALASAWYHRVPYRNTPLVLGSTRSMLGVHSDEHHRHASSPGATCRQIAPGAADSEGIARCRIRDFPPGAYAPYGAPLRRRLHAQRAGVRPRRGGGESAVGEAGVHRQPGGARQHPAKPQPAARGGLGVRARRRRSPAAAATAGPPPPWPEHQELRNHHRRRDAA